MRPEKWCSATGALLACLMLIAAATTSAEPAKRITPMPGMTFVYVPAGTFAMGSPADEEGREDARAFAEWVSGKAEGDFRLPTEAEWEYACRAGTVTRFSWGDKPDCAKANFGNSWTNECGREEPLRTVKTGSYPANPWGLHDMHGNAWEWTGDWFAPYPDEPVNDPAGPDRGERRAVRGGSWWSYSRYCRSASRVRNSPDQAFQTLGFRLVMTP